MMGTKSVCETTSNRKGLKLTLSALCALASSLARRLTSACDSLDKLGRTVAKIGNLGDDSKGYEQISRECDLGLRAREMLTLISTSGDGVGSWGGA